VLVFAFLWTVFSQNSDLITNLPGAPPVKFAQYSGYITVNDTHQRTLFYWFVESQNAPATDPLVLWLNGGPGCSSLGGLLSENGPFYPNTDGKTLRLNNFSWNRAANVVYLESPSGVGFSYSNTTSDYTVGDYQTAADSVVFLQRWLTKYPQYQKAPFWVTGESYGGHYVPNLAQAILQANAAGGQPQINLAGFQVGNAWTNAELDNEGAVDMWLTHALISQATYDGFYAHCNFSQIGPLADSFSNSSDRLGDPQCNTYQAQADKDLAVINIYDIYSDVCLSSATTEGEQLMKSIAQANPVSPFPTSPPRYRQAPGGDVDPDPCIDDHVTEYLNQPSVQSAIHAKPMKWSECSNAINYSRDDLLASMFPVYQWLFNNSKIRILVYSGDVDGIVPVTGTRKWIAALNLTIAQEWRYWLDSNSQTGGYTEVYNAGTNPNGLTFATVRDAGHMVPWTQGGRSYDLFTRFLLGKPL
jgi:serine carboxypeptidase-like clade 2